MSLTYPGIWLALPLMVAPKLVQLVLVLWFGVRLLILPLPVVDAVQAIIDPKRQGGRHDGDARKLQRSFTLADWPLSLSQTKEL